MKRRRCAVSLGGAARHSSCGRCSARIAAGCALCWADAVVRESLSAIEQGPALLISQSLVVKHEFSDLDGKLCALPLALQSTSILSTASEKTRQSNERIGLTPILSGKVELIGEVQARGQGRVSAGLP